MRGGGLTCRSMQQLIMFRHFYIMVVVYVYFTRILVYLLEYTLPEEIRWLSNASEELATLVFYALTAAQFRPHASNKYTKLVSESEIEMGSF
jgi:G protein-coupled receptor 107